MLVYGDRVEPAEPAAVLEAVRAKLAAAQALPVGILRHERQVAALIEAGRLAQGLADAAFEAQGEDAPDPAADAAMALTCRIAAGILGGEARPAVPANLPDGADAIQLKAPEGYAFYALYPETYAQAAAAADFETAPAVLGLRSIGTSLAAMAAAQLQAKTLVTARPCGHPFTRELRLAPTLRERLRGRTVAVVDEGPGLSGSSFGAAADLLEFLGARPVFLPSHLGDLGPQASEPHRRRWAGAPRVHMPFEVWPLPVLPSWFADVLGQPTAPLEDISGGAWRRGRAVPAHPQQERRKFILRTLDGEFLLKFCGLGRSGSAKFERAQALHAAGFTPQPVALRHGFLAERWHGEARPLQPSDRARLLEVLGGYLDFRRTRFPAEAWQGAPPAELIRMAAFNTGQLLGETAAAAVRVRLAPLLATRHSPVRVDGRLHAWEWLVLPDGRILKTDALDHDDAHDLIGCQDIAWDVAGAAVELELTDAEVSDLCSRTATAPELMAMMRIAYAAFQAGLWTFAGEAAQVARYRAPLAALLA